MREISLAEQVDAFRSIPNVDLVYCQEPTYDILQQIENPESVSFNVVRGERTFTMVVPTAYWMYNPVSEEAKKFIVEWFQFMNEKDIKNIIFYYRESEDMLIRLKGTLKMEEVPENAQILADKFAECEHVVLVKPRKIIDLRLSGPEMCNCPDSIMFFCEINIRTKQSVPSISIYTAKSIWDNLENHEGQVERLKEQIQVRLTNSKREFGEDNIYV